MRIILNGSVSTVKRLRISLGTLVAIEATADSTARAETAIAAAFAAIAQIGQRMHPWTDGSDLARINGSHLHVPVKVHPSVGELLNLARRINTLTDGIFDPCLPAQPGRLSDIEVSKDESEIVCHTPVALDFGGFAKGYAVDRAVEALMVGGCSAGLVNAGGDLRVFGPVADPVFVRGPSGELTNIELTDAALAVSDANSKQRPPEHQGYYVRGAAASSLTVPHAPASASASASASAAAGANIPSPTVPHAPAGAIPAVGANIASPASSYAAVIAGTAVVADALAKCVLLCPPPVAARALRAFNATQPLVPADGAPPPTAAQ